jgi:hypothetical protein
MSKPTVTRLFIGGVIAVIAGAILAFVALWAAYAGGVFEMSGPDVVGINSNPAAWTFIGLAILAAIAMIAGFIAGLVSWIGALLNTADLVDKTWFIVLLVLGLLSFGFIAMIAYVIAGPDSRSLPRAQAMHAPA